MHLLQSSGPAYLFLAKIKQHMSRHTVHCVQCMCLVWHCVRCLLTCCVLSRPSKEKGVVTMPTVRIPRALAAAATTGAAPLPVPPPMPAYSGAMCSCYCKHATCLASVCMLVADLPVCAGSSNYYNVCLLGQKAVAEGCCRQAGDHSMHTCVICISACCRLGSCCNCASGYGPSCEHALDLQINAHRNKYHVCALQCLFDGGLAFIGSSLHCKHCVQLISSKPYIDTHSAAMAQKSVSASVLHVSIVTSVQSKAYCSNLWVATCT